jgi:AAA+ superfamily predicted ATPase
MPLKLDPLQLLKLNVVFLRVLEYYDGILILTSNRVGTFDEAFKSRIQLALHYPKLVESDRRKIWRNFIHMLKEIKEDIDIEDLNDNIDDLAKHEMNGREIRNALTTARQLAQFKKEKLCYEHLELAIRTASEFNKYLEGTRGFSDDAWARAEQLR